MLAACLQLRVGLCTIEDNLCRALGMAEAAAEKGAELLVFPELFLTGFCYEPWARDSSPHMQQLEALVQEQGCTVIGSIIRDERNQGFCLWPGGFAFRPKIHPFGPEKEHLRGGEEILAVPTMLGRIGLQICYDLRFPEVARALSLQGADILVTVAQFPASRLSHWRALCLARAIENQVPHIACNCAFPEGGGQSMIIDAWGQIQAEAGPGEEAIFGEIDLAERDRIRQEIPCWADRRPELY